MHMWGDPWPYWKELYSAQDEVVRTVRKYTRCNLISKEKWGCIRFEYMFPPGTAIFYRNRWQKYWSESWIARKWTEVGFFVAKCAILRILKKRPYLAHELLHDAVTDERFGFNKYMAVLCGWQGKSYGNDYPEE